MSGLPSGWEADYDGSRWFYRYKPSGITQYTFPRAGDEFPEHFHAGAGSFDLAPEERLASEQQVKRRSTLDGNLHRSGSTDSRKKKETLEDVDEMGATGYFDPASFMYLGPGSYNDISPLVNEEVDINEKDKGKEQPESLVSSVAATPSPAPPATIAAAELYQPESIISTHATGESVTVSQRSGSQFATDNPVVHMLDGQPVHAELSGIASASETTAVWSPIGQMAELGNSDIKCADELAPIELDASTSAARSVGMHMSPNGPVELPTEGSPLKREQSEPRRASAPPQFVEAYPLVSASFSFPSLKEQQESTTSPNDQPHAPTRHSLQTHEKPATADIHLNGFQPWNPASRPASGELNPPNRSSQILSEVSVLQTQDSELGVMGLKGQSISRPPSAPGGVQRHPTVLTPPTGPKNPTLVGIQSSSDPPPRSPVPAALRPAQGLSDSQLLQDQKFQQGTAHIPGSHARHDSISSRPAEMPKGDTSVQGLAHVPSILKPANYRQSVHDPTYKQPNFRHQSMQADRQTSIISQANFQRRMQSIPTDHRFRAAEPVGTESAGPVTIKPPAFRYIPYSNANASDVRPTAHRVNTVPSQLPSQESHRPSLSGPGLFVFQEFSPVEGPLTNPLPLQEKPEHLKGESPGEGNNISLNQNDINNQNALTPNLDTSNTTVNEWVDGIFEQQKRLNYHSATRKSEPVPLNNAPLSSSSENNATGQFGPARNDNQSENPALGEEFPVIAPLSVSKPVKAVGETEQKSSNLPSAQAQGSLNHSRTTSEHMSDIISVVGEVMPLKQTEDLNRVNPSESNLTEEIRATVTTSGNEGGKYMTKEKPPTNLPQGSGTEAPLFAIGDLNTGPSTASAGSGDKTSTNDGSSITQPGQVVTPHDPLKVQQGSSFIINHQLDNTVAGSVLEAEPAQGPNTSSGTDAPSRITAVQDHDTVQVTTAESMEAKPSSSKIFEQAISHATQAGLNQNLDETSQSPITTSLTSQTAQTSSDLISLSMQILPPIPGPRPSVQEPQVNQPSHPLPQALSGKPSLRRKPLAGNSTPQNPSFVTGQLHQNISHQGYQISNSLPSQSQGLGSSPSIEHQLPVTRPPSSIPSQVSSPAQSIASLHQTPSSTFSHAQSPSQMPSNVTQNPSIQGHVTQTGPHPVWPPSQVLIPSPGTTAPVQNAANGCATQTVLPQQSTVQAGPALSQSSANVSTQPGTAGSQPIPTQPQQHPHQVPGNQMGMGPKPPVAGPATVELLTGAAVQLVQAVSQPPVHHQQSQHAHVNQHVVPQSQAFTHGHNQLPSHLPHSAGIQSSIASPSQDPSLHQPSHSTQPQLHSIQASSGSNATQQSHVQKPHAHQHQQHAQHHQYQQQHQHPQQHHVQQHQQQHAHQHQHHTQHNQHQHAQQQQHHAQQQHQQQQHAHQQYAHQQQQQHAHQQQQQHAHQQQQQHAHQQQQQHAHQQQQQHAQQQQQHAHLQQQQQQQQHAHQHAHQQQQQHAQQQQQHTHLQQQQQQQHTQQQQHAQQQHAQQHLQPLYTQEHQMPLHHSVQSPQSTQSPIVQLQAAQPASQNQSQNQTLTTAETTAALVNAGKEIKGWAKRMFKNPVVQQTTAVVGGALVSEVMGGNAMSGAMLANGIYKNSHSKPTGRPPGPIHAQTAPPQAQGLPGPKPPVHVVTQTVPGMQPIGIQTPGRPFVVQNPAMAGVPVQVVQQPGPRPPQPLQARPPVVQAQWQQGAPITPALQMQANNQSTFDQNIAMSSDMSGGAGLGAPTYTIQPLVQNNVLIDNSTSDSYFAAQQPVTAEAVTMNIDNTSASNMDMATTTTSTTNLNMVATGPAPTYMDNSTFASNTTYADTTYADTTYVDTTNINVDTTTMVDVNVDMNISVETDQTYVASGADEVSMYSVDGMASESVSEWSTATVDYSGGDWGSEWE